MAGGGEVRRREVEVSQIEISALCHATEDCSRIEESIRNILPSEARKTIVVHHDLTRGYYGNPITVMTVKITGKNRIDLAIGHIAALLEQLEKTILRSTFDLRYDRKTGKFVIRFSKQDMILGKLRVTDSDDVVKVVFYLKNTKNSSRVLRHLIDIGLLA